MQNNILKQLFIDSLEKQHQEDVLKECSCLITDKILETLNESLYNEIRNSNELLESIVYIINNKFNMNVEPDSKLFFEHYDKIFSGITNKLIARERIIDKKSLEQFIEKSIVI